MNTTLRKKRPPRTLEGRTIPDLHKLQLKARRGSTTPLRRVINTVSILYLIKSLALGQLHKLCGPGDIISNATPRPCRNRLQNHGHGLVYHAALTLKPSCDMTLSYDVTSLPQRVSCPRAIYVTSSSRTRKSGSLRKEIQATKSRSAARADCRETCPRRRIQLHSPDQPMSEKEGTQLLSSALNMGLGSATAVVRRERNAALLHKRWH